MSAPSLLTLSSIGFSSVVLLGLWKYRRGLGPNGDQPSNDMSEFLDWIEDIPVSPVHGSTRNCLDTPTGDNVTLRGLAALGLAPTAPREARNVRPRTSNPAEHPASGNDDIADDVVRVQRISEEEEAERYFSAFSFYKD